MCACDVRFNGIEKLYIVLVKRLVWAVSGKILELTQASDGAAVTASHQWKTRCGFQSTCECGRMDRIPAEATRLSATVCVDTTSISDIISVSGIVTVSSLVARCLSAV